MSETTLLLYVAGLSGVLVTAWLLAVSAGPDWLRPGHGPLWYFSAATTVALGIIIAVLQHAEVMPLHRIAGLPGTFNAVVLALILVIALFPVMRLAFSLLHKPGPREAPIPRLFIYFGIAPDGSPLVELRWMLRALAVVGMLIALLSILGMDLSSVIGKGPQQHTLWAFGFAGLLGVLFGSTHPVRPVPEGVRALPGDLPAPKQPFDKRIDALHRWLGSPAEAEVLPEVSRDRKGSRPPDRRFGLDLYPFQSKVLDDLSEVPAVALAGPAGTGRTTATLLRAIDLALATGASCAVITPTREQVREVLRHAKALCERISAGAAVTIDDGVPPRAADLWIVCVDDLERFLDDTIDPGALPILQRLRLVVIDDLEQLFGPEIARLRFLVYRLLALRAVPQPQLLLAGNLAPPVLQLVAERVATQTVRVIATAGENDATGAASRGVRRFVVEPGRIDHKSTSTFGLLGVRDGYARVVTEVEPGQRLNASLLGAPWDPWPAADQSLPDQVAEVLLARIGPRSAWHVLGHRRYYAESDAPAHEYLLFADDPLSQQLLAQFRAKRSWWPAWYDTTRFPRILSAVPGGSATPEGLLAQARSHMRAALDKGFCDVERLRAVFSPEVADQVLAGLESSRSFERFEAWRPNPDDPKKPKVVQLCRAQGAATSDRTQAYETAELRDPSLGLTFKVPAALLDVEFYDGAIIQRAGRRYRVAMDPGHQRKRQLLVESSAMTATPIRSLHFAHHGSTPMDTRFARYGGAKGLETVRCSVQLQLTHHGVHFFGHTRESPAAAADSLQRLHEQMLQTPHVAQSFVTRAWMVCLPDADEVVLHTLSHVLRDSLDYFFLGASDFIGVGYELDLGGKAGVVFYDRHPEGLGCLDDIDDAKDLQAVLAAAREILAGCDCDSACAKCCRSVSCTRRPHNHDLDRKRTLIVLDALLSRGRLA